MLDQNLKISLKDAIIMYEDTFHKGKDTHGFMVAAEMRFKKSENGETYERTRTIELLFYSKSSYVLVLSREVDSEDIFLETESLWRKDSHHHSLWKTQGFKKFDEVMEEMKEYELVTTDIQLKLYHVNVAKTHLGNSGEYVVSNAGRGSIGIKAKKFV